LVFASVDMSTLTAIAVFAGRLSFATVHAFGGSA
jgi:hypothetical protein